MTTSSTIQPAPTAPRTLRKTKLIWLSLLIILGFVAYFGTGFLIDVFIDSDTISYGVMIAISTLTNFIVFSGIFFIFGVVSKRFDLSSVGLKTTRFEWWWLLLIPAIVIAAMPFRSFIGIFIELIIHGDLSGLTARSDLLIPSQLDLLTTITSIIGIGILAPIGEELFFRGFIHTTLIDHFPFWLRVTISSLIFAFGHYDSVGVMATSFIMGVILAITYERSQSLWFSIGIHIVNNSISIALIYGMLFLQQFLEIPAI